MTKSQPTNKHLKLEKTHDFSASDNPSLAVVFIHGIASDSSTFGHALEHLEKNSDLAKVRFITFDLLGSGKSYGNDELNYDYKDQLEALNNSIEALKLTAPLVLIGHSMGTLIVTRYANNYKQKVERLILLSPPIYTVSDLEDASFAVGMKFFKDAVSMKNRGILEEKSFNNSMEKIVLSKDNYQVLANTKIPTVLIYGDMDQFIGAQNIPELLKKNPNISAIKTIGRHGVSRDKFTKIEKILEEVLDAQTL